MVKMFFFFIYFTLSLEFLRSTEHVYFDNFNQGDMVFGLETKMTDYAVLANDPLADLPTSFTICSSLFVQYMTSSKNFLQLFQDDGSHWLHYEIEPVRNFEEFNDKVTMNFNDKSNNFWNSGLPIVPHSWYHACVGLNTVSGHLRVVVNGYTIVDEIDSYFIGSSDKRPKNLIGKINIFKTVQLGYWYQSRGILSNMNIFGSQLTIEDMDLVTNGDKCGDQGDYLSWARMEWNISGSVEQGVVSQADLCQTDSSSMVLLTESFPFWDECMNFCPKMRRARSPMMRTNAEFEMLLKWLDEKTLNPETKEFYPGVLGAAHWIAVTDLESEGTWIDYYTQEKIEDADEAIFGGELNGGTKENCGLLVGPWRGWNDWSCEVRKDSVIACSCQHPKQMYLRMRGLCQDSFIDQYYVPSNKPKNGATIFVGLLTSVIEYIPEASIWKLEYKASAIANTTAVTESSHFSFVLGSHQWTISEDNKGCSKRGQPYTRILKLTGCQDGEFTCRDGQCISMEERCDQILHCRDESDERECSLLVIKDGYNSKVPPFTLDRTKNKIIPVKVNVSTILKNIIEISEVNHIIELKFGITLKWYENRANYHNLKQKEALNTLSDEELGSIWIPYIIFENTDNDEAVTIDNVRSTVSVTREGSFLRSGSDIADEIEIFKGEENKITMNQTHSKQFHCTYMLHYFPFDTQVLIFWKTIFVSQI